MKVILINSYYNGSTGGICQSISEKLSSENVECLFLYGNGPKSFKNNVKYGNELEYHVHTYLGMLLGNHGLYSFFSTLKIIYIIKSFKPDIVHLHNLHGGYLNFSILLKFLKKRKVKTIITIHDCWIFTGKCYHYADIGCIKYQSVCRECQQLKMYPKSIFFDRTESMFKKKKNLLEKMDNLYIVAISEWLYSEVNHTFLKKHKRYLIKNGINERFAYSQITGSDFYVLGVASSWSKQKGLYEFLEIAKKLNDTKFIMVGEVPVGTCIPQNVSHFKKTQDINELIGFYRNAGIFVNLSTQETFGLTVGEALFCGTPCVVYNSTACPELITNNENGFVVEPHDVDCVTRMIIKSKTVIWDRRKISAEARNKYSINRMVNSYFTMYEEVQND